MTNNMNTKISIQDKEGLVIELQSHKHIELEMTSHKTERTFIFNSDEFVLTSWRTQFNLIPPDKFESARKQIIKAGQKCANQEALNAYYHCLAILEGMRNE